MIKVVLIGYGNVNSHLLKALSNSKKIVVAQVYTRSKVQLPVAHQSIPHTQDLNSLKEADVYIMAISDDAILDFSKNLPLNDKLVVHTSGGVSIDNLSKKNRRGVFYPLQTFSKNKSVNFKSIPICIEADNSKDKALLWTLGEAISDRVVNINSDERAKIHVAAVFVNNFVNYLYHIGQDILEEDGIPFDILSPLIQETAKKIEDLSPEKAQTGPAKRSDQKTIEKHRQLVNNKSYKEVYDLLTKLIQEQHSNK